MPCKHVGKLTVYKNGNVYKNVDTSSSHRCNGLPVSHEPFTKELMEQNELPFVIGAYPQMTGATTGNLEIDDIQFWFKPLTEQEVKKFYEQYHI